MTVLGGCGFQAEARILEFGLGDVKAAYILGIEH